MELSWAGREPFTLDTGETRGFLEDGDTMTLRGTARGDGFNIGVWRLRRDTSTRGHLAEVPKKPSVFGAHS